MNVLASGEALQLERNSLGPEEMCDIDFPLGPDEGCSCQQVAAAEPQHSIILKQELCIEAANRHGAEMEAKFALESEWMNYHPKGCFKDACVDDPSKTCYFFNGIEPEPAKCPGSPQATGFVDVHPGKKVGTPVCQRKKYINGTTHTATHSHGGCPNGYGVIFHELKCTEAGTCLGDRLATEFRVTANNESEHNVYPNGCFLDKATDMILFNNPHALNGVEPTQPGRNGGTQICQVSTDNPAGNYTR